MHESPGLTFQGTAERFVAAVDNVGKRDERTNLHELSRLIAILYASARELPRGGPAAVTPEVGRRSWESVYERLGAAGIGGFYARLEPIVGDDAREEVVGDLAEDIAEIYADVEVGLREIKAGAGLTAVALDWRESFDCHWGQHAVDALLAIHALLGRLDDE